MLKIISFASLALLLAGASWVEAGELSNDQIADRRTGQVKPKIEPIEELEPKSMKGLPEFIEEVREYASKVIYWHKSGIKKYQSNRINESGREDDPNAYVAVRLNSQHRVHSILRAQDLTLEQLGITEVIYRDELNIEDTVLNHIVLLGSKRGSLRAEMFFDDSSVYVKFEKGDKGYAIEFDSGNGE